MNVRGLSFVSSSINLFCEKHAARIWLTFLFVLVTIARRRWCVKLHRNMESSARVYREPGPNEVAAISLRCRHGIAVILSQLLFYHVKRLLKWTTYHFGRYIVAGGPTFRRGSSEIQSEPNRDTINISISTLTIIVSEKMKRNSRAHLCRQRFNACWIACRSVRRYHSLNQKKRFLGRSSTLPSSRSDRAFCRTSSNRVENKWEYRAALSYALHWRRWRVVKADRTHNPDLRYDITTLWGPIRSSQVMVGDWTSDLWQRCVNTAPSRQCCPLSFTTKICSVVIYLNWTDWWILLYVLTVFISKAGSWITNT